MRRLVTTPETPCSRKGIPPLDSADPPFQESSSSKFIEPETPLIDACRHERVDAVAVFLESGADVNEPKTDGSGATPLYCLPFATPRWRCCSLPEWHHAAAAGLQGHTAMALLLISRAAVIRPTAMAPRHFTWPVRPTLKWWRCCSPTAQR